MYALIAAALVLAEPSLDAHGCDEELRRDVMRLLRVELPPGDSARRFTLTCDAERATIAPSGERVGRSVDLEDAPGDQTARLLALSAIELLEARRNDGAKPAEKLSRAIGAPEGASVQQMAPGEKALAAFIDVYALYGILGTPAASGFGTGLSGGMLFDGTWLLRLRLQGFSGTRRVAEGRINSRRLGAGLGGGRRWRLGVLAVDLEVGVFVEWLNASAGETAPGIETSSFDEVLFGPALRFALRIPLTESLGFALLPSAAYQLAPIDILAGTEQRQRLDGLILQGAAGIYF